MASEKSLQIARYTGARPPIIAPRRDKFRQWRTGSSRINQNGYGLQGDAEDFIPTRRPPARRELRQASRPPPRLGNTTSEPQDPQLFRRAPDSFSGRSRGGLEPVSR